MNLKTKILRLFEKKRGKYISGEAFAETFAVSRTAIWKAISQLKKDGYKIDAITNRGYRLSYDNDIISEEGIRLGLKSENKFLPIHIFKSIDSTNIFAKQLAANDAPHGSIVISNEQTAGRGRMGRQFFSPAETGLYLSIVLKPKISIGQSVLITTGVSVAVAKAIRTVSHIEPAIKWVNDIYINHKKVSGILTEAITDFETGTPEAIIVGVGVNFIMPEGGFPQEITEIAGSVFEKHPTKFTRNSLAAEITNKILGICRQIEAGDISFLETYREQSNVLGKQIEFYSAGSEKVAAKAIDIDESGGLIVELADGTTQLLNSGEISVREVQ